MNFKKLIRNKKFAFTLAEVVVVMAILGVMMAAFAPVVTKRTIATGTNSFRNFQNNNGVGLYYGTTEDSKAVIIGDTQIRDTMATNLHPKLLITANNIDDSGTKRVAPQIEFAYNDGTNHYYLGQLLVNKDTTGDNAVGSVVLGGKTNAPYTANGTDLKNATIIGANACPNGTAKNLICIGANSGPGSGLTPADDSIYIGRNDLTYDTNKIFFGNNDLTFYISNVSSDIRLKNVGKEFTGGLDEINKLTFYNFTYKRDSEKTPRVGVMAQDLQKVFPNAVSENKDGYLYIRKDDMFYAALNAIKDLFKQMTDNSAKIKALEERNAVLEKQVKELQDLYIDLANKVDKKSAKKKLTITPETVETEEIPTVEAEQNTLKSMPETDTEMK